MKKVLSIALILALALSLFAGCKDGGEDVATSALGDAKAYLEEMYQTGEKNEVMVLDRDKEVLSVVTIDGVTYPVEWSITVTEGASDAVKIGTTDTANHVIIDLPDTAETDILFTAVATVKDAEGKTEAATFSYKMICTLGDLEFLDKAYALNDGEKLSGTPSLTGDIVEVKTPWDEATQSITIVMQVGEATDKLVQCLDLKGDYVDGLVVGDNICVQGVLGKVDGIVGFESGCTLVYVNKADGSDPSASDNTTDSTTMEGDSTTLDEGASNITDNNATQGGNNNATQGGNKTTQGGNKTTTKNNQGGNKTTANSTPTKLSVVKDKAKILKDAFALGENECTPYIAELTGKVLQTEAYNEKYGSVTVTIDVDGKTIECYQMKGNGCDKVKAGDTLTVRGVIKNYFYEGATKGKVEFAWHEASGTEVQLVKLVSVAAQDLSTPEKILAAAKKLKNGESLQKDVTLTGEVLDVETAYSAEYDNITVNIRVNGTDIKCYRMKGNGIDKIQPGDKVTVMGKIKNFNGIIEFDTGCQMTKRVAGTNNNKKLSVVESPKAGVAYKFGMVQPNANKDAVYYLKGDMSGFYMATSSNSAAAVDVYLEETSGGYYLYAMVGGKKQYINMVLSSDGAHVNGAYESTAKTVYTYDTSAKTLVAEMTKNGETAPYWFGTRNDKSYTTVGPCATEYDGFYCQFYA